MPGVRKAVVYGALALVVLGLVVTGVVVRRTGGSIFPVAELAAVMTFDEDAAAPAPEPPAVAPSAVPASHKVTTVALRRGDNLIGALAREGVAPRVGNDIAAALRANGARLRRMKPRDTLEITWSLDGAPQRVAYDASPWLGFAAIARDDGGWRVERAETRPDVRAVVVAGEVKRSLFHAVEEAGEAPRLVIDLVEVFQSDFDFTADSKAGDRFRLLVEKRYAGESFVDYGRVLGAQYVSDGRVLTGVAFESAGTKDAFYDLAGRSLKKSFLKSPLEFTRITSGFTYARPHPILGGTRPHLAIDYGAPVGTPVRAVADATVLHAGWAGGNGIQVRLRHRAGYETMYNHLSRTAVRAGQKVRQRQVIGYVGSTGLSTGPHLDYRVSRNGVFVNPLSEKFLPGEPIGRAERARFNEQVRTVVKRLETEAPF
ncbi:MAG: M23 family metallopeptidase [Candidatus Rokubacteria bacterium]|nr:M23 family metallopeptidase [Candidatus Rokubacteria bacterium]